MMKKKDEKKVPASVAKKPTGTTLAKPAAASISGPSGVGLKKLDICAQKRRTAWVDVIAI